MERPLPSTELPFCHRANLGTGDFLLKYRELYPQGRIGGNLSKLLSAVPFCVFAGVFGFSFAKCVFSEG